jgi:hypothetical protein
MVAAGKFGALFHVGLWGMRARESATRRRFCDFAIDGFQPPPSQ